MIVECFPVGPLQCNCVVLADERSKSAVVVDPGDDVRRILEVVAKHGLKVETILATHAHIDHVGALGSLQSHTGAAALINQADWPLYEQLAAQAQWLGVPAPPLGSLNGSLEDGVTLKLGSHELRILHTPGHSPGSVCFLIEGSGLLLAGDTLFAGSIGRTDLWGGSFPQIMHSIKTKLLALGDSVNVISGHGPPTTIGQERRTNPFVLAHA